MQKNDAEPSKQNLDVLEGKDKKEFLRGAEIAYESVLTSFATGDLIKLKALHETIFAILFPAFFPKQESSFPVIVQTKISCIPPTANENF